ncbi:TetR/AcrR family transcriptional regulator C-terminal domain-containing protein [Actinomadura yumaensis]|uniref:TetR/AcrR family transcriptional regulator C-terminal domain-containing protein n=1 Tax=Actinomadura yumaensis TaxID=111807 RepID=UPI0036223F6E
MPRAAIETWQENGPLRVRRALAERLTALRDRGLLNVPGDPERAALHLLLLISAAHPSYRAAAPSDEEVDAAVAAGVRAFLHGYAAT